MSLLPGRTAAEAAVAEMIVMGADHHGFVGQRARPFEHADHVLDLRPGPVHLAAATVADQPVSAATCGFKSLSMAFSISAMRFFQARFEHRLQRGPADVDGRECYWADHQTS